jgi:hypothetical protein
MVCLICLGLTCKELGSTIVDPMSSFLLDLLKIDWIEFFLFLREDSPN